MISIEEADSWIGRTAVDNTGEQIGMITQIWVDDASGHPEWASVKSALGGREALVPLAGAAALVGGRQFAYSKEQITDAPRVAQDGHLEVADKERISAYYGSPEGEAAMASAPSWSDLSTGPPRSTNGDTPDWQARDEQAPAAQKATRRFRRKASSDK